MLLYNRHKMIHREEYNFGKNRKIQFDSISNQIQINGCCEKYSVGTIIKEINGRITRCEISPIVDCNENKLNKFKTYIC